MASSVAIEEKQLELEIAICRLSSEKLTELAEHLEIPIGKYTDKSKLVVTRVLRDKINETIESHGSPEESMEFLSGLDNFINDTVPPLESGTEKSALKEPSKSQDTPSLKEHNDNNPPNSKDQTEHTETLAPHQVHASNSSLINPEGNSGGKTASGNVPVDMNKLFRREFKIRGQIGAPGAEDKLSFISLVRQIESALAKGYQENEIIDAVIRAISPGMPLRSYLESTPELTLARLRQILRSHFRESNATELYQQLASLTQSPKEEPQTFLMKALELRQKILFASKEADVTIKYDRQLVQSLFLHCLETGLQDDVVRIKMRPLLQKPSVSDEELIKEPTPLFLSQATGS